jgi:hypothetical protein
MEVAERHVGIVEFQTSPPRVLEGLGVICRDLHGFSDKAFSSGKILTPPASARHFEESGWIARVFSGHFLKQADARLVILPFPGFFRFLAESLDCRLWLIRMRLDHVSKISPASGLDPSAA